MAALRVQELAERYNLSPSSTGQLEKLLLSMQHRTYLWLHLAMNDVEKIYAANRYRDEVVIETLPATVGKDYDQILDKIDDKYLDNARTVFLVIVDAQRPLKIAELACALDARQAYVDNADRLKLSDVSHIGAWVRSWCGLFVYVQHSTVYLIHQTAKEFLLRAHGVKRYNPLSRRGLFTTEQVELEMARLCAQFLYSVQWPDRARTIKDDDIDSHRNSPASLTLVDQSLSNCEVDSFFQYCAQFWNAHLYSGKYDGTDEWLRR